MKRTSGYNWAKSILIFAIKAILILVILVTIAGFAEVDNALHPPRLIPPGNTLRKYKVEYQSVNLITDDGIRLSA